MLRTYCGDASLVLAHGPWFDACLWHSAILPLQKEGLRIISAALPFSSFDDDRMALQRGIDRAPGPVVLVATRIREQSSRVKLARMRRWWVAFICQH